MAVTAEVKDRVGWITLDRPPDNACDAALLEELDRCVGQVAEAEGGYRIGLPEVTLGLLPGLPRLIGRGRALELMTSGRTVTPAEAERLGMVDRLVPASEFDTVVADLAAGLAGGAPLAVAAITRVVNDGLERSLADGLDRELEELASLFATEDAREASPPAPRSERLSGMALIEGAFLTWLHRDDWRTSHPEFTARCHESLRALLVGAGR